MRVASWPRRIFTHAANLSALELVDHALDLVCTRDYRGMDRIPRRGGAVIVCNHLSVADPPILATGIYRAGRTPKFLGMAELLRWPLVGLAFRAVGYIPVYRDTPTAADALKPAVDALKSGRVVALYPEGRITTQPDYRPEPVARTGAVRMALEADVPIVPVAQWGAHRLLTRERRSSWTRPVRPFGWLRKGRERRRPAITLLVGEPIPAAVLRAAATVDGQDALDYRAATALVMDRINDLLAQIAAHDLPHLADRNTGLPKAYVLSSDPVSGAAGILRL